MNAGRAGLALALAAAFAMLWAVLRFRNRRGSGSAVLPILRATSGFLAVLCLLKIVPALQRPTGLLRDDLLFPLWALWRTATAWWWFGPAILAAAAIVTLGMKGAAAKGATARARSTVFLTAAVLLACGLWISLSLTHEGWPDGLVAPFLRSADYQADVGRFASFPEIWSAYTQAQPTLSTHGRTHPPGAVALLWVLGRATGGRLPLVCLAIVLLGALTLIPLHRWARLLLTPDEARATCLIWILVPAVSLYGATCMDMVFALVLLAPLLVFTAAVLPSSSTADGGAGRRGRAAGVLLSGAGLGLALAAALLVTFSTAVLATALGLVCVSRLRERARGAGTLAAALVVGAAIAGGLLVALRPLTGFDWMLCLRTAVRLDAAEASPFLSPSYYLTTRLMDVLDFLVLAGVAAAPFWLGALRSGLPARASGADTRERDSLLLSLSRAAAVAMGTFFVLGAFKIGETGRIFLFFMPLVAACVARTVYGGDGQAAPAGLAAARGLVLMSLQCTQTLLMQMFLDTRW